MRYLTLILVALALSGCSSFKLGGMVYCPFGASCTFQQISTPPEAVPDAPQPPAPAASSSKTRSA